MTQLEVLSMRVTELEEQSQMLFDLLQIVLEAEAVPTPHYPLIDIQQGKGMLQ